MDGKKRGSVWGAALGAAVLLLGALIGLPRFGVSGQVWTIAGAVLLGYNVWALLRRSGKSAAPPFAAPDPEAEAKAREEARAALAALEARYKAGEVGYEAYMKQRLDIVSRL